MYKLLIVSCLSAVALATPEADADAGYLGYAPALPNLYPNWPGYSLPGFSRTVYGARSVYGKRSADAEPGYGLAPVHAYALTPAVYNSYPNYPGVSAPGFSRTLHGVHKRSADAHYGYGYAPAVYNSYPNWPGVSAPGFSRTLHGVHKRSADAHYGYGLRAYAPYGLRPYGLPGVAGHPTGTSFVARSPQGLRGKRSADASYGYGYAPIFPFATSTYGIQQAHPSGSSFQHVSRGLPLY